MDDDLAAIKRKVADADRRVERQLGLIEELIRDGHDPESAVILLAKLEQGLRVLQERQAYLEDRLDRLDRDR